MANDLFLFGDDGYKLAAGGTSAAAPLWAGLTALINQQKAAQAQPPGGFMNPALYAIGQGSAYASCFHDTAVGNNTNYGLYLAEIGSNIFIQTYYNSSQFFAVAGYDLCTGWGTPIGAGLINTLCPEPLRITPSTGFVSSGPYGGPFNVSSQNILLTNIATASFNWGLATTSPWLSAAPSRGTLFAGGAAASVTVALNATVSHQTVGAYTNTLWLTNLNDGVTQSQQVRSVSISRALDRDRRQCHPPIWPAKSGVPRNYRGIAKRRQYYSAIQLQRDGLQPGGNISHRASP